MKVKLTKFHIH